MSELFWRSLTYYNLKLLIPCALRGGGGWGYLMNNRDYYFLIVLCKLLIFQFLRMIDIWLDMSVQKKNTDKCVHNLLDLARQVAYELRRMYEAEEIFCSLSRDICYSLSRTINRCVCRNICRDTCLCRKERVVGNM